MKPTETMCKKKPTLDVHVYIVSTYFLLSLLPAQ